MKRIKNKKIVSPCKNNSYNFFYDSKQKWSELRAEI